MVHGQIVGTILKPIFKFEYDKVLAAAIGTGIGLGRAIDEFGDYWSQKRGYRDFTKPRRRKGDIVVDEAANNFGQTLRTKYSYQRGSSRDRYRKRRKICTCRRQKRISYKRGSRRFRY